MSKRDLLFEPPIMNAAGMLGFFPDMHFPIDWAQLGAFVTNPISLAPRTAAHGERFAAYPGGFLFHTGYPNLGLTQVLHRYARLWSHSSLPVIIHLLGHTPEEVAGMVQRLEIMEGVGGVEVGVDAGASPGLVASLAQAAAGELPVIMRLPFEHALELAPGAIQAGAMAVSLAPPRGLLPGPNGVPVQGRLYGPSVYPGALHLTHQLVKQGIPTIGSGGIYKLEQAKSFLSIGAIAVQLDSFLWHDPGFLHFK